MGRYLASRFLQTLVVLAIVTTGVFFMVNLLPGDPVLIYAGADVNARDADGVTPLMWAGFQNETPDIFRLLLDAGADVRARDSRGRTPLMWAAWGKKGTTEILGLLLDAGADVHALDQQGQSYEDFFEKVRER